MALFKNIALKKAGSYLIELIIVVLGVSIAFQLSVWNESRNNRRLEIELLKDLAYENSINKSDFEDGRQTLKTTNDITLKLITSLSTDTTSIDTIRTQLAPLLNISWPDLSTTHLENYLQFKSNNSELKTDILRMKTQYTSFKDLNNQYIEIKKIEYFNFLSKVVDFSNFTILDENKIRGVEFKNQLILLVSYEASILVLYDKISINQSIIGEKLDPYLDDKYRISQDSLGL